LVLAFGKWTTLSGGQTSMRQGFGLGGIVRRMGRSERMPMLRLSTTE
jgi:hypothetical protein